MEIPGGLSPLAVAHTNVSTVALNLAGSDIKVIETTAWGPV